MRTPRWLYESLPLTYAFAGFLCLFKLGPSPLVVPSALLFIGAGMLAQRRRHQARQQAEPQARRSATRRRVPA